MGLCGVCLYAGIRAPLYPERLTAPLAPTYTPTCTPTRQGAYVPTLLLRDELGSWLQGQGVGGEQVRPRTSAVWGGAMGAWVQEPAGADVAGSASFRRRALCACVC